MTCHFKVSSISDKHVVLRNGHVYSRERNKFLRPGIASHGYRTVSIKGRSRNIGKLVLETFITKPGEEYKCVNHKDGDKTNDRLENLEWATYSQNNVHAYDIGLKYGKKTAKIKSKYRGVSSAPGGRWRAHAKRNGKYIHIGQYATEDEARDARNKYTDTGDLPF